MGLEMNTGSVTAQLDTMNCNMNQVIENAERLLYQISCLEDTTEVLKGLSYDSIRDYYNDAHTVVVRGIILFAEAFIQENNAYKGCIAGNLGGIGYVNEDALRDDKRNLERQIQQVYSLIDRSKGLYYTDWLDSLEDALRLVEKKLKQIEDFLGSSSGLYQNAEAYKENVKRGIECLNNADFDGNMIHYQVNSIDREWRNTVEAEWQKRKEWRDLTIKEPFVNIIVQEFGFDKGTGEALYKLYELMRLQGVEDMNQKYFAMLASVSYTYDKNSVFSLNFLWHFLSGTDSEVNVREMMISYGLEETEVDGIFGCVSANHEVSQLDEKKLGDMVDKKTISEEEKQRIIEESGGYFGKIDMAHMAVTLSTILKPDTNILDQNGFLSGRYNGIYDLNKNAGYVGDVYGTAGNGPKLTADDYKADLDAVNLSKRLEEEDNLILVMNRYYGEIGTGKTNRAEEFVTYMGQGDYDAGLYRLTCEANEHTQFMKEWNPDLKEETLLERKKIVANFILNLEYRRNEYEEYVKVDWEAAENMEPEVKK